MSSTGQNDRRRRAILPVAQLLMAAVEPGARRRGFARAEILSHWPSIVGGRMARFCQPIALKRGGGPGARGDLIIRVPSVLAVELQHTTPQIIERVNDYFGFQAVRRVKLVQGPIDPAAMPPAMPRRRALSAASRERLDQVLTVIEDDRLKDALGRLGEAVSRRHPASGREEAG